MIDVTDDVDSLRFALETANKQARESQGRLSKARAAAKEAGRALLVPGVPVSVVQAWRKIEKALSE